MDQSGVPVFLEMSAPYSMYNVRRHSFTVLFKRDHSLGIHTNAKEFQVCVGSKMDSWDLIANPRLESISATSAMCFLRVASFRSNFPMKSALLIHISQGQYTLHLEMGDLSSEVNHWTLTPVACGRGESYPGWRRSVGGVRATQGGGGLWEELIGIPGLLGGSTCGVYEILPSIHIPLYGRVQTGLLHALFNWFTGAGVEPDSVATGGKLLWRFL